MEARKAAWSEAVDFWFEDLKEASERFTPDAHGGAVRVLQAGSGARIRPRSLVKLRMEGVDPADGRIVHSHEILLLVPPLGSFPGYDLHEPWGPPLSDESRQLLSRRHVGIDPEKRPALITHWGSAVLPWDGVYRMREGGTYEMPHPTMATVRGINDRMARPFSLARPEVPVVRYTVLMACRADLRRVEYTYLEWAHEYIQHPRRLRTETWHELHGCLP